MKNAPEYYAEFRRGGWTEATARTPGRHEMVAAAFDWLGGRTVMELRSEYPIIDGQLRALEQIEASLLEVVPNLAGFSRWVQPLINDLHELWFEKEDRDVKVSFWGKSPAADFTFRWDQCVMAKIRSDDLPMIARALEGWLVEHAAPDEMRRRFPSIPISKVADFYAAGQPIEGEFLESWDRIEKFFAENSWPGRQNAMGLVTAMRQAGYDRKLRAGQSMLTLMVSRSRRHGLRAGHPCIQFFFSVGGIRMVPELDGERELQLPIPALNPSAIALLDRLAARPVE
ncbi:MAG TPA: hypothetical protein VG734_08240 [Lacunisphaera sp.]|nr:hypothetical protein [Lacunisphaera sp.]